MKWNQLAVFGAVLACQSLMAQAPEQQRREMLNLSANASAEVARDIMQLTLSTTREGADAAQVQGKLKQALEQALEQAKKVAKPGQIEVQTGNFSLTPVYRTDTKAGMQMSGWTGSAELIVHGRDVAGISQLAGRIQSLTVGRVAFSLSREAREQIEGDVAAQAIARFRAKAADFARQFGFKTYRVVEVSVQSDVPQVHHAPMMMRSAKMSGAEEALPVEAGKTLVSASVSGSIQLLP
ncbi:SIMPL domain-containing protein [Roseateles sp. BYS180W]|uniref:SIMPL domain-containing protein n=1 Tax=Roseateles rivi TaxID=3299028 RepID=A0ABW7FVI5_9BURK